MVESHGIAWMLGLARGAFEDPAQLTALTLIGLVLAVALVRVAAGPSGHSRW